MKLHAFILSIVLFFVALASGYKLHAQPLHGVIFEEDSHGHTHPLVGANVYWLGTTLGVTTNGDGYFSIPRRALSSDTLIVSFVGYGVDTLQVWSDINNLEHTMGHSHQLDGVTLVGVARGTHLDRANPIQTQVITAHELQRAACCNLSESFETNATVDVSYTDAITGAKQIQLLGLAGVYSQIQVENIPTLRGLASGYGLGYVPGSWMESIQVSKGTASVANGYESISGQINVEYKKPWDGERFYLNGYANSLGMAELNANVSAEVSPRITTMVLAHAERMDFESDHNNDGFLDHPKVEQYHLFNRWGYRSHWFEAQAGFRYLDEGRTSGQVGYEPGILQTPGNPYGIDIGTQRIDGFMKLGYIFDRPGTSLGLIASATEHNQESYWGPTLYDATQRSLHSNLIFLTYIGSPNHNVKTGMNFNFDDYNEILDDTTLARQELVPGAYFEYTYKWMESITLMGGVRYDQHSIHGGLLTPRFHAMYNPNEHISIRTSAGKGFRSPSVIAENMYLLASARSLQLVDGVGLEEAWSYGVNLIQCYLVNGRELTVSTDYYRTFFINRLVIDTEQDFSQVYIYSSDGQSYSNSFQAEASYTPANRFVFTAAYRLNDVKVTLNDELIDKPLVSRHKGLVTTSYVTPQRNWQMDYTVVYNGGGRLPNTSSLPQEHRRNETFPGFVTMNIQVTRFINRWDLYLGVENLTGFVQENPIVAPDNPYGPYFDASMVWGPLSGARVYLGFRLSIDR